MYHIIFSYNPTIIQLGKATVISNQVNNYWATDDPKYEDWTTKKLKVGDTVRYYSKDGTKTDIGTYASSIASRVTLASTISDVILDEFEAGPLDVFVEKNYNTGFKLMYSYPIDKFVGSCAYTKTILSLFFERTEGKIDEVRLNIKEGYHTSAIEQLNKEFREEKNNDIVVTETDFSRGSKYIIGVNKVLTSISPTRK